MPGPRRRRRASRREDGGSSWESLLSPSTRVGLPSFLARTKRRRPGTNCKRLRQVFLRKRVVRALVVPDRVGDPPALAVPEELDRVDAAPDDRAAGSLPRLVG